MTNLLVEAGPGSGKTTTLVKTHNYLLTNQITGNCSIEQYTIMEAARQMFPAITPNDTVFVCMTNSGKEDLISKLNVQTKVFTYNGLGASLLCRFKRHQHYDGKRGEKLVEAVIGRKLSDLEWKVRSKYYTGLRYIKCLKEELMTPTPENLFYVQQKYGIDTLPPENIEEMRQVMERMMILNGSVEYIDQVWCAVANIPRPAYKVAYVDECQDLSLLKLLLMKKCAENLFLCGDPYQAINGFAGADYDVFTRLIKMSQKHLPLKTCFRCPPNRIEKANSIRPARIIPFKTEVVPDEVVDITELPGYLTKHVKNPKEHMMIARLNNILLRVGIKLLLKGISCHIMTRQEDRAIDKVIKAYIEQTRAKSLKQLVQIVENDKANADGLGFNAGTFVRERADCVLELSLGLTTIEQLIKRLDKLTEQSENSIPLCTIHKAKGLEAKNIYILYPPVPMETENLNQREQEINLEFVAETRSSHQTIYVVE